MPIDGSSDAGLSVREVSFSYGRKLAIDKVSFDAGPGSVLGLVGPNGAGKTTLIRMLATVLAPMDGTIRLGGASYSVRNDKQDVRQALGYLPQDFGFYSGFSVYESLAYVAWLKGVPSLTVDDAISAAMEDVHISDLSDVSLRTLSGGQLRRVGIAQALVNRPRLLLLDEPTAGLDPGQRLALRGLIRLGGATMGVVVVATHLIEDVSAVCDLVVVMDRGRAVFVGPPAELGVRGTQTDLPGASALEKGYMAVIEEAADQSGTD